MSAEGGDEHRGCVFHTVIEAGLKKKKTTRVSLVFNYIIVFDHDLLEARRDKSCLMLLLALR